MRTPSSRSRQAAALAALAMTAAALAAPTPAQGNVAGTLTDAFAPQLVTVDTPTPATSRACRPSGST